MNDTLAIGTFENKNAFLPGETVAGKAMWILEKEPTSVEIRLFWYTEGKGTQDVGIVATKAVPAPDGRNEVDFSFTLPVAPYSFSGKLISLLWALEVVALPVGQTARYGIVVSPTRNEIILHKN